MNVRNEAQTPATYIACQKIHSFKKSYLFGFLLFVQEMSIQSNPVMPPYSWSEFARFVMTVK